MSDASGSNVVFLVLYVDDILLIGNNVPMLQDKCFAMKDLGNAACILGIRIYQDRTKRLVGFSQSTYLDKILKKIQYETGRDEEKQKVVSRVPTEENLMDPFTKALTRPKHEYHIEAISSNFEMIIFYVLQAEIHRVLLYDSVMLWCTPTLTVTGSYTGYVQIGNIRALALKDRLVRVRAPLGTKKAKGLIDLFCGIQLLTGLRVGSGASPWVDLRISSWVRGISRCPYGSGYPRNREVHEKTSKK
ncbi:hypothetical protein OSB04_020187 [Centaurea solstitialis]|uniref:Reverse transcriptase Ty1/copia-type domain-containing protein n=1 Tax=Centaurea solstitialis TaxID=347529 RepID=A0AA38STD1_9ASTR|nr:hypothetical protein OSB04_020187 [Centaurea solstitialis]